MTSAFNAEISTGDAFVVVTLIGELDLAEVPALRKTLDRVTATGPQLVVADAAALEFIDSSGIGVLVGAHNVQESRGGVLVIANLSEATGRPLRLTEVDSAVPVHWAGKVLCPWADEDATPSSILTALGFAEVAASLPSYDADSEPIG